jgi:hypothetical protein
MYTLQGKPDQHATCTPHPVRVWFQTIRISHGQCIATFCEVVNRDGQSHCSCEKGIPTQSTARRQTNPWVHTQFLFQDSLWSCGGKPASIDSRLLGLPGPYRWHAISTFNTCSWGPTHQSLTDTGEGYNLGGAGFRHTTPRPSQPMVLHFSPKGPARSQVIQSQQKPLVKWCETPITDPWSFDHSTSTEAYVYT